MSQALKRPLWSLERDQNEIVRWIIRDVRCRKQGTGRGDGNPWWPTLKLESLDSGRSVKRRSISFESISLRSGIADGGIASAAGTFESGRAHKKLAPSRGYIKVN